MAEPEIREGIGDQPPIAMTQLVDLKTGAVSRAICSDQAIYEQEIERIFARCWLYLYSEQGKQELTVTGDPSGIYTMVDEFCEAFDSGRPPLHDGHRGTATVEVCLAMPQSASEQREVRLTHQVPVQDYRRTIMGHRRRPQGATMVEVAVQGAEKQLSLGIRNYWYPVFRSKDLGAKPTGIKRLGEDLVLWRDAQDQPHCFSDYCPHRSAKLSLGHIHGNILQCWYHGWQFDPTGQCRLTPTEPEGLRAHERMRVRAYPTKDRGGLIWVFIGEREPPPLQPPEELESPEWNGFILPVVWKVNWLLYLDNLVDPLHGPFLHARSYTLSQGTGMDRVQVREVDDGLIVERATQKLVNFDGSEFHLPSWFRVDIPYPRDAGPGGPLHIVVAATPIDEESTALYFVRMRRVTGWKWWLWRLQWRLRLERAAWNVIEQDRIILESQRGLDSRRREHLIGSDAGVFQLRALLLRKLTEAEVRASASASPPSPQPAPRWGAGAGPTSPVVSEGNGTGQSITSRLGE